MDVIGNDLSVEWPNGKQIASWSGVREEVKVDSFLYEYEGDYYIEQFHNNKHPHRIFLEKEELRHYAEVLLLPPKSTPSTP